MKSHGLKVTPQRLAIYDYLYNTDKHPSAEIIYNALEEIHPSMSLATVYKTIDTLKKHGLIQELNVGENCFRYDATIEPHIHLICGKCNSVLDMHESIRSNKLKEEIESRAKFKITSSQLYFYGLCKHCNME